MCEKFSIIFASKIPWINDWMMMGITRSQTNESSRFGSQKHWIHGEGVSIAVGLVNGSPDALFEVIQVLECFTIIGYHITGYEVNLNVGIIVSHVRIFRSNEAQTFNTP